MKKLILYLVLVSSSVAFADLPYNNLWKEDNHSLAPNGMTEEIFRDAINEVLKIYKPIVADLGGNLVIEGDWEDSTVNAWTTKRDEIWYVQMYGGLARRKEITKNAFKMVICHEIAHHIGGYPTGSWAAIEGQADYVTSFVCAKKVLKNDEKPTSDYDQCKNTYKSEIDQQTCNKTLDATQSLANLLASLRGKRYPEFSTPDPKIVSRTSTAHPEAQCRLDTFLAGAICTKKWNDKVIPKNAGAVCDNRPKCWFYN